jgi:hypothetical protein
MRIRAGAAKGLLDSVTGQTKYASVDRAWMLDRSDSVCLTDGGRDLTKNR